MLQPTKSTESVLPLSQRLRNSSNNGRFGVNRVKDGNTIGALRATGGPPGDANLLANSVSGVASSAERGSSRRGTSLLDLPGSGRNVLSKLQGQVKSSNPLLAGLSGDAGTGGGLASLTRRQPTSHSFAAAQSQAASLRRQSTSIDSRSRFMQAQTSLLRSTGGFGANLASSTLNLFA